MVRFKVRIGEYEIKNEITETKDCDDSGWFEKCNRGHQDFDIANITVHPGYKGKRNLFQHDIALIRLKAKVKKNGRY